MSLVHALGGVAIILLGLIIYRSGSPQARKIGSDMMLGGLFGVALITLLKLGLPTEKLDTPSRFIPWIGFLGFGWFGYVVVPDMAKGIGQQDERSRRVHKDIQGLASLIARIAWLFFVIGLSG